MNPFSKRIVPLPPPNRTLAVSIILGLFGIAAFLYFTSLPALRSLDAKRIPGAKDAQLAYLPDEPPAARTTLADVISRDGEFVILSDAKDLPVMNETANSVRWFRLTLSNSEARERRMILDLIWRVYDQVTLFAPTDQGDWSATRVGTTVSIKDPSRSHRKSAFELTLPPGETVTYYLRTQDYYRLPTQFQLWSGVDDFIRWEIFDYAKGFGYFALWLGMIATGLFLYAMVRERAQLYFVLFAFFVGAVYVISLGAVGLLMPWPAWPLGEIIAAAFGSFGLFFLCLFARQFLRLPEEDPLFDRIICAIQWCTLSIVLFVFVVFSPKYGLIYLQGCFALGFIVTGMLVVASVRRWWAGSTHAPFFLLAFTPYVAALAIRSWGAQDYYVRDDEIRLLALIANALTLIFLSFATAYRHRLALVEKQQLQLRYQDELVAEVAQRTEDLTVLTERLSLALSDRDQVLAIIGHDLSSPAANLFTLTQLISEWPGSIDSKELKEHTDRISQACERQLELLNNLLEWGRLHLPGSREPSIVRTSLRENVEKAWQIMELSSSEKNLRFDLAIDSEFKVATVPRIFQTVMRNLLANAIKFTPASGLIRVSAEVKTDGRVEVRVRDSGVGIPPEKLEILTRNQVKSSVGTDGETGTGIGLRLSSELAISLGATLEIESEPGEGTEAIFTLPGPPAD